LLVADERIKGMEITKLPGGGLEFGEGPVDCVKREFKEETGQEVRVLSHYYTTDFFVPSAFDPTSQIISIYYLVEFCAEIQFSLKEKKFDFASGIEDTFVFRFLPQKEIGPEAFTFPIDKKVAELIRAGHMA
jgi:8-oxo-dGTP diphosphatase